MSRPLAAVLLAVVVVLSAACGEVPTNHLADAPPGGSDDAHPTDGAAAGLVTITALAQTFPTMPLVGAQVVFTDSKGSQRAVTDATGTASARVEDGATVTVVSSFGNSTQPFLETVYGVKNGDKIKLGVDRDFSDAGSFTVKFAPTPGVSDYQVYGPCGESSVSNPTGGPLSVDLAFQADCKQDPMELVVVGTDPQTGLPSVSQDKTGVPFVAGGSATLTGGFKAIITLDANFTNGRDDAAVNLSRFAPDTRGFGSSANAPIGDGTAKLSVAGPATSTAFVIAGIDRTGFGSQSLFQRIAGDATTYSLDIAGSVLPWLGAIAFDPATRTIKVPVTTEGSKGDAPDLFACEVGYARASPTPGGAQTQLTWLIVTATPGDVVLPTLPADLAGLAPLAGDATGQADCISVESDQLASYDSARQDPFTVFGLQNDPRNTGLVREASSTSNRPSIRAGSPGRWSPLRGPRAAARAR